MTNIDNDIKNLIHFEIKECRDLDLNEKSPALINAIAELYSIYKQYNSIAKD